MKCNKLEAVSDPLEVFKLLTIQYPFFPAGTGHLGAGRPTQWVQIAALLSFPGPVVCPTEEHSYTPKRKCPEIPVLLDYSFPVPPSFGIFSVQAVTVPEKPTTPIVVVQLTAPTSRPAKEDVLRQPRASTR